jgi:hypothetical protein
MNMLIKIIPFVIFLTTSMSTSAEKAFKDNPYSMFSAEKNHVQKTTIEWRPVENLQNECEK